MTTPATTERVLLELERDEMRDQRDELRTAFLDIASTFTEDRDVRVSACRIERWHKIAARHRRIQEIERYRR